MSFAKSITNTVTTKASDKSRLRNFIQGQSVNRPHDTAATKCNRYVREKMLPLYGSIYSGGVPLGSKNHAEASLPMNVMPVPETHAIPLRMGS
jgi:hypothetical protein